MNKTLHLLQRFTHLAESEEMELVERCLVLALCEVCIQFPKTLPIRHITIAPCKKSKKKKKKKLKNCDNYNFKLYNKIENF